MKKLIAIMAVVFTINILSAQEYKIPVQNSKEGKITLNNFMGDLPIEGYNGNEIIITSDRGKEIPDRAKGLKPVYSSGTDNTGMALSVEKNGNQITVHCLLPITQRSSYKIKIPNNFSIKVESGCERSNSVNIQNIQGEIEINVCQSIKLKNVSGPLVLSNISGDIDIIFTEIIKDKPISIASISGEIDITIPSKASVDLEMGTISGNMFSDFDFAVPDKSMKKIGGSKINHKLNGGGANFNIHTISGNIYLRKG